MAGQSWPTTRAPLQEQLAGVRTLRIDPASQPKGTILHFHGGGFRIGCPEMDAPFAERLADRCAMTIRLPAYRLAPEHPYPAGLADAVAVLEALDMRQPLFLCGASAGGGIAASLAVLAARKGIPLAGLLLLSPWLDLRLAADSLTNNADSDPLFSLPSAKLAADLYLQGWPAEDPLVSPLLAAASIACPVTIIVGTGEVLRDDARQCHSLRHAVGAASTLIEIAGMDHVAVTRDPALPGAQQAFDAVVKAISQGA